MIPDNEGDIILDAVLTDREESYWVEMALFKSQVCTRR